LGGFAGMLIVVRPGAELDPIGIALGLLTALVFAFFQMATRRVGRDDPLTTNYYGGVFGAAALTLALPWFWSVDGLTAPQWILLFSTGVTGFFGHWLQISAYSRTPATLLAPFSYLQILAATALGWLLFDQLPGRTTALGIGLICVSGLGVVLVEVLRAKRTPSHTPPALETAAKNKNAN
jgi:drug/metabolite transporter (DMT)-like permease